MSEKKLTVPKLHLEATLDGLHVLLEEIKTYGWRTPPKPDWPYLKNAVLERVEKDATLEKGAILERVERGAVLKENVDWAIVSTLIGQIEKELFLQ